MDLVLSLALYGLPLAAILGVYLIRQNRVHARHRRAQEDAIAAGMTEPASLRPRDRSEPLFLAAARASRPAPNSRITRCSA